MAIQIKYRFWIKSKSDNHISLMDCEGSFSYALKQIKKNYDYTKDYEIIKVCQLTRTVSAWEEAKVEN